MSSSDDAILNPKRAVVGRSLPCRTCGYDLRGLRMDARCPECGLAVRTTVDETIDPKRHEFPDISNPRGIGNALLWLAGVLLLCGAMLVPASAGDGLQLADEFGESGWMRVGSRAFYLAAAGVALFGLRGAWLIAVSDRRSGEARLGRLGGLIAVGLLILAVSAIVAWSIEQAAAGAASPPGSALRAATDPLWPRFGFALGGGVALLGFGRVLESVGQRSRMYREARGGKQSARVMAAALAIIAVGTSIQIVAIHRYMPRLEWIGEVAALSCAVMVVVGCIYLAANAWWVRRALTRPSLRLRDLVRIEPDTTRLSARPAPATDRRERKMPE